jgi:hypothetical protein
LSAKSKCEDQTTQLHREGARYKKQKKQKEKESQKETQTHNKTKKYTTPMGLEPIIFATGKQRLTIRPWCQFTCSKELNE